ncbi:DUF4062 domain-containing protein [Phycicoccus ginsengisoli]
MTLRIDLTGTPANLSDRDVADWAADQRVFISSVMGGDMTSLRERVAHEVADLGAHPVCFERFGGRDDDAEVAYLAEVDSSTIYLGLLARTYGRLDRSTHLSATHAEYRRAEEHNLPLSVWVRDQDDVQADQLTFIEEVRTFHTTGRFTNADDLAAGVRTRLREMAASDLSPWVKLEDTMFRATQIHVDGANVTIDAVIKSVHVLEDLERMRAGTFGSRETVLTYRGGSWPARVTGVATTTTASRSTKVQVMLERGSITRSPFASMSIGMNSRRYSSDDVTRMALRSVLFGERGEDQVLSLGGRIRDFTADLPAQRTAHDIWTAAFDLLFTEAFVGSGRAQRVLRCQVSAAGPSGRTVRVEWVGHDDHARTATTQSLTGTMPI